MKPPKAKAPSSVLPRALKRQSICSTPNVMTSSRLNSVMEFESKSCRKVKTKVQRCRFQAQVRARQKHQSLSPSSTTMTTKMISPLRTLTTTMRTHPRRSVVAVAVAVVAATKSAPTIKPTGKIQSRPLAKARTNPMMMPKRSPKNVVVVVDVVGVERAKPMRRPLTRTRQKNQKRFQNKPLMM